MTLEANLVNDRMYGISPLTPWSPALRKSTLFFHRPSELTANQDDVQAREIQRLVKAVQRIEDQSHRHFLCEP